MPFAASPGTQYSNEVAAKFFFEFFGCILSCLFVFFISLMPEGYWLITAIASCTGRSMELYADDMAMLSQEAEELQTMDTVLKVFIIATCRSIPHDAI